MNRRVRIAKFIMVLAVMAMVSVALAAPDTAAMKSAGAAGGWTVGVSGGRLDFEGDEPVEDGFVGSLQIGRDVSEHWTLEAVLDIAPGLDESIRRDWRTMLPVSRLEEEAGEGVHDTTSVRLSLDALYHFSRWERFDPYLAAGVGGAWYDEDVGDDIAPCLRAGVGAMYHLTGTWALRADARWLCVGRDTEQNLILSAGVVWSCEPEGSETMVVPVAAVPTSSIPVDDVDADGLKDAAEKQLGTDPEAPDTDRDGLTDREEVETFKTDPLNPDTDYDGLKDGEEVKTHKTDPLQRDSDGGGVADGHEAIEDCTDPLAKADDLEFYELQMTFENDGAVIKAEYLSDLDAIAKVLKADAGAQARVEGHVDRKAGASAKNELKRTERRAESIRDYFVKTGGVEKKRVEAVGYGFSRPKAANDAAAGNPANRRMEIYIRRSVK